ncbi:unnamed protein product [Ilex paraguariensis]|uniref:Glycosyl transferase family 1 domain-containing protein n=1 Tax=Ilex paraguariensis TaxID=185542 RepID=A0ABC8UX41_9AQUA
MEDGNVARQSLIRPSGGLKSTLSGRSTPRGSPSFKRLNSGRTPRKEGRTSGISTQWFRNNRIVLWLLLITLWTYAGFYIQSRWAHGDNKEGIFDYGSKPSDENAETGQDLRRNLVANNESSAVKIRNQNKQPNVKNMNVVLAKKGNTVSSPGKVSLKKKNKRSARSSRRKIPSKKKPAVGIGDSDVEVQEEEIPNRNTTYGLLVGPFGPIEDRILEWSPELRSGTCDRKGEFARLVWSRKFVLIFHELSFTGAPLAMMELATELLSCGATVSVVVLSKRGGLMPELARRKIKVLEDREKLSFKTAMKSDLVIAGSAVCASWIEQYLDHNVAGSKHIAWWIMENRHEYFNRSKPVLNRVKMLIFLSELQSKQWLAWCEEENIKLRPQLALVPLSVSDELAFAAGITCSLTTPAFSTEKMLEKRQFLRDSVRKEMGLTDNDMLVMSLSSITPGKGQYLLLESARLIIEQDYSLNDTRVKDLAQAQGGQDYHSRALLQSWNLAGESANKLHLSSESSVNSNRPKGKHIWFSHLLTSTGNANAVTVNSGGNIRKLLSGEGQVEQTVKVLIGSVGSKSNKALYVKALLKFLSRHSNLSSSIIWTPATIRVASLYAAADVYVMNSQGLGETFGRVTIEAMAFGLPVLGTDNGGTKEIVEHNVTGLLHPLGRPGTYILAQNLRFLLKNPSARQEMGIRGRKKVEKMYLKRHMYERFAEALIRCMRMK